MDDANLATGVEDAARRLRNAMTRLRTWEDRFEARMQEIDALEARTTDAELKKAIGQFRDAFTALNKERLNVERDVFGRAGALGAEPVDFDAARTEVGRLLDSLRAARGSGGVSGEPQP